MSLEKEDIIDKIQESHDEPTSHIVTITDYANYILIFGLYYGLFAVLSQDLEVKMNGMFVLIGSIIGLAFCMFAPTMAVAYHVQGKKYIRNFVFYGSRMIERNMEILNDPLVIAKKEDDAELETLEKVDDEYATFMREMGITVLTDKDIDSKIEESVKRRFDKAKAKKSKTRLRNPVTWLRNRNKNEPGDE